MVTNSFYHNLHVDSDERTRQLLEALERSQEISEIKLGRKPRIKYKNYKSGSLIRSLDDFMTKDFVFFQGVLYSKGWFQNWQIRLVHNLINGGQIHNAIKLSVEEGGDS